MLLARFSVDTPPAMARTMLMQTGAQFNAVPVEYYLRLNGGGLAVGIAARTYNPLTAGSGGAKPVIVPGGGVPGPTYRLDLSNVTITQNYSGDGGGFYATAAWGTPMQDEVRHLRAFRDQYLLTNEPGRKFVEIYYTVSPPVADYIRGNETLRSVVRTGLKPLVELSRQLVSTDTLVAQK